MPPPLEPRNIVVVGDIVIDRHVYVGERHSLTERNRRGVGVIAEHGGAALLLRLLDVLLTRDAARRTNPGRKWDVHLGVDCPSLERCGNDGYAIWEPYPVLRGAKPDAPRVWRASRLMGYAHADSDDAQPPAPCVVPDCDLLVLDDAGFRFRHGVDPAIWRLAERTKARDGLILLKMSEPVAQGELWHGLTKNFADHLVCLVSARDLRRERLGIGHGLSWEATLDDLCNALNSHPAALSLKKCRHLIVAFHSDAGFWLDQTDPKKTHAQVCFDPARAEGEWTEQFEGESLGFQCAMAASLTLALAQYFDARRENSGVALDLKPAIEAGLVAMRDLRRNGHGPVGREPPSGYPVVRLAERILDTRDGKLDKNEQMARIGIDWPRQPAANGPDWSIVDDSQYPGDIKPRRPTFGLAWQVAQLGTVVLERLPHACFGKLLTADRAEIEALRHIRDCMRHYHAEARPKRPLSIGVFGPPGAGKSFGVKQLAEEVFGDKSWREFNLSQFRDPSDLNGAFHQLRDLALAGLTPVVLWDEFDSRELTWLQYLLAPMQDGRFQEGQLSHSIGKCVFIFAGGTSWTFDEFRSPIGAADAQAAFRLRKGPDFVSRLDAHLNVPGPNQRSRRGKSGKRDPDPNDVGYPLRRALLIRAFLGHVDDKRIDFDPALLHALLHIGEYRHGTRSLEKLIEMLRAEAGRVRRSALPRPEQLAMHVDHKEFMTLMKTTAPDPTSLDHADALEKIAAAIHRTWRDLSKKEEWPMRPHLDKPYAQLANIDKEDNRAAARRMPEVLALAGLGLSRNRQAGESTLSQDELEQHLRHNIERLAEAEHDGWMDHRARNGWRYAARRDDDNKLHPDMRPYAELTEAEKKKDRNSVLHYPDFAQRAGYRIVRLV